MQSGLGPALAALGRDDGGGEVENLIRVSPLDCTLLHADPDETPDHEPDDLGGVVAVWVRYPAGARISVSEHLELLSSSSSA